MLTCFHGITKGLSSTCKKDLIVEQYQLKFEIIENVSFLSALNSTLEQCETVLYTATFWEKERERKRERERDN